MLDNLLGNKTNILVLRFLIKFENQFFPVEEIADETGAGLRNIKDSLRVLSNEGMLNVKTTRGKNYYKFDADSRVKELISLLFEEERKRISFKTNCIYKIVSEIESKIIKVLGSNLRDIILFGSIAKGRDTANSDIDLCVIVDKKEERLLAKLRSIQFNKKFNREVQIHVFTSREFIEANKEQNLLIKDILRDGLSLKIGK